jgi:hypothetical protein
MPPAIDASGVDDDVGAGPLERLDDTGSGRDQHTLSWLHERGDRCRGAHDVTASRNPDSGQRVFVLGEGRRRVVRDEQHPTSRSAQRSDGVHRPGDRLMGQPDHAVEVTQHRVDRSGPVGHADRSLQPEGQVVTSCRRATFHAVPSLALQRSPNRRSDRAAIRRLVGRRPRRSRRPQPLEHHPCRRSPRVSRSEPVRHRRHHAA